MTKKNIKLGKQIQKHYSVILTCVSVVGVVSTVVSAVRATPKALNLIRKDSMIKHNGDPEAYSKQEAFHSAWKCYISTAVIGGATIASILGTHILNNKQQSALIGAYSIMNSMHADYKRKLKELYGEEAHQKIMNSIVKEKCKEVNITAMDAFGGSSLSFDCDTEEKRLFYDEMSNRYFESTFSRVLQAEYHLNRNFILRGGQSLNEFYAFLGIEGIEYGNKLGWNCCDGDIYWIDFDHHKTVFDDGLECYIIEPVFDPWVDFDNCL